MIAEAIEKIVKLATPKTYEIGKDTYTIDSSMRRIEPHVDRVKRIAFSSLDGVVKALKCEINRDEIQKPVFVNVDRHDHVSVFTTYRRDNLGRDSLYEAAPELPLPFSEWSSHDDAIIMLRSQFEQNGDVEYLLDLLSRLSSDDSVTSEDNGVTQKITATTGVDLKRYETPKARVILAPFRTFLEVGQPESEFLLRIKAGDKEKGVPPKVGIIEADGGAWKLAAKANIANYFRAHLADLIENGDVIVTE